jgi:hypothetical protein
MISKRWRARSSQKQQVITTENPRVGSSILPLPPVTTQLDDE